MSQTGKATAGPITFEQLISLNDEMAALVRAGIPLEGGLAELGRELPGKSGRLAEILAQRMIAGESLPQILASEKAFPPVWRAVVEAGLRSGQLAVALESMSATARRMAELRKTLGAALVYPLVVLGLAYLMFLFVVTHFAPVTSRAYEDLTGSTESLLSSLSWLGENLLWWAAWVPMVVALLLVLWWRRSARVVYPPARQSRGTSPRRWFSLRSALGTVLRDERMAIFADILALLLRQQVPLVQALVLAAEASGDIGLRRVSQDVAERLERGEVLTGREQMPGGFPPVLGWLIASGAQSSDLSEALSHTAGTYRERAARTGLWTAVYLPIVMTVGIGGTATLILGLITFTPIVKLWYGLARPF